MEPRDDDGAEPAAGVPLLRLRGVSRAFDEGERRRVVLRDVDLELAPAEVVAVLGPSGSGKSTLLNLVSGIDDPDGGSIEVEGRDLSRLSERERTLFRRHQIGFVFQFFNLIPTLTVEENLRLPLELAGRDSPAGRARAAMLLRRIGLGDRAGTYPDRLSGGEQQRVAIARALVHEPTLILADEPTGNLDGETGRGVLELLNELVRGASRAMLVVTHSPEVLALADRVLTLRDGRLWARD